MYFCSRLDTLAECSGGRAGWQLPSDPHAHAFRCPFPCLQIRALPWPDFPSSPVSSVSSAVHPECLPPTPWWPEQVSQDETRNLQVFSKPILDFRGPSTQPCAPMLIFVFGVLIRDYSWLFKQESLLVELEGPCGVTGMEPGSVVSRQTPYLLYYHLILPPMLNLEHPRQHKPTDTLVSHCSEMGFILSQDRARRSKVRDLDRCPHSSRGWLATGPGEQGGTRHGWHTVGRAMSGLEHSPRAAW